MSLLLLLRPRYYDTPTGDPAIGGARVMPRQIFDVRPRDKDEEALIAAVLSLI